MSFLPVQNFPVVIREFVLTHIVPNAPSGKVKFGLAFLTSYIQDGITRQVEAMLPSVKVWGIIDEQNRFDLDKGRKAALDALNAAGGKVPLIEGLYDIDAQDLEKIFEIARRHATN